MAEDGPMSWGVWSGWVGGELTGVGGGVVLGAELDTGGLGLS